jgi:hypothetical protein
MVAGLARMLDALVYISRHVCKWKCAADWNHWAGRSAETTTLSCIFFPFPCTGHCHFTHTHIHQPKVIAKTFFQLKSFQETFREKCNNDPYPGYCSPRRSQYCATLTNRLLFFSCSRPFYTLTSSALVEKKVASVNKDKKRPTNRDRSCNSQGCSGQGNAVGSEKK